MIIDTSEFIGGVSFQNFLLFIFVIVTTIFAGNIARILILRFFRKKGEQSVRKVSSRIVMYSVYIFGFYFAFVKIINLNIPAFLAALGILGITFLLTMLPILQQVFAGLVLSFERPFREGDIIDANGTVCIVKDIFLRKTVLRSIDGKILIIPNMNFINGNILNYSKGEFIRVELNIKVKNDSGYNKAVESVNKILHENPSILPNVPKKEFSFIEKFFLMPRNVSVLEPKIFVMAIEKDSITLQIWFWIWDILKKERIVSDVNEAIIEEFHKNKISLG